MGVEYYLVCDQCEEYIDLHKSYAFDRIINATRPPFDFEPGFGSYWNARGLWFIWAHKNHGNEVRMTSDQVDEWFKEEPYLKEMFPHSEDLKMRENAETGKKEED